MVTHADLLGDETSPLPSALLVITDRHRASEPLTTVLSHAARGGARWIRVREPDLGLFEYVSLCHVLVESVANARVVWSVRPHAYAMMRTVHPELRLAVHLTERDAGWSGPDASLLIGRSVHQESGADALVSERSDYLLFAPVFATACKPDARSAGLVAFGEFVQRSPRQVIALGGVTASRVASCRDAGAAAVAVCGGIMESDEPEARVRAYLDAWDSLPTR